MAVQIRRKHRNIEEIPLASTADIAFLLIIFFLAASAMLELKGVKMPLPRKDAPPMRIEKKNLFKVEVNSQKKFLYQNSIYSLIEILKIMEQEAKKNSQIVFAIKIDPNCPSEVVPELIYGMQQKHLFRFSITIKK